MKNLIEKYPFPSHEKKVRFSHPVFTLDLHGFSEHESQKKLDWFLGFMHEKHGNTFRVITGIGSLKLYSLVQKTLKQWKRQKKISDWKEKNLEKDQPRIVEGSDEINEKTGVFLVLY